MKAKAGASKVFNVVLLTVDLAGWRHYRVSIHPAILLQSHSQTIQSSAPLSCCTEEAKAVNKTSRNFIALRDADIVWEDHN